MALPTALPLRCQQNVHIVVDDDGSGIPANTRERLRQRLTHEPDGPVAPFVTAFLAHINCDLDTITYCNAGHFPPILLRADGRTELLEKGGPLLGALEGAEFQSGELMLEPGDTLVAYSDGVLECRNTAGEEFGLDRLTASAMEVKQPSPHATLMMLLAAVQDFANGSPLSDDVSLTVIQRDGETNWL